MVVGHMGVDDIHIVFSDKSTDFTDTAQPRDWPEMFVEVKFENAVETP
jgi:hypothetical protein